MWQEIARELGFQIPDDELARITPILEDLFKKVRLALDRDLSTTSPVLSFKLAGGAEEVEIYDSLFTE